MKITPESLMSPQVYSRERVAHRARMIAHRRTRTVALGPCMRLQFEDEFTVRYQIHEVLRAENVVAAAGVQHEIDRYAHLLPDGMQWRATLMIELPDAQQRQRQLSMLNEAVHELYVELPGRPRVRASANEDLPDRHRTRPSAVHFFRFALPDGFRSALGSGERAVTLGCEHPQYAWRRLMSPLVVARLAADVSCGASQSKLLPA